MSSGGNLLDGGRALHLERCHDLQRLAVLFDLAEPVTADDLVAYLHDGLEVPEAFAVERVGVLSALEEDALHLVEVVLQTVEVLAEHARGKLYLEHMACELGHSPHFQSAGALEYLNVDVLTDDLDDLAHKAVAAGRDVADLTLLHRPVYAERYHIGDNATNCSFCHNHLKTRTPSPLPLKGESRMF